MIGATIPLSNDRGHLLEGVPRAKTSPWGDFKGTWDSKMDCQKTVHSQTLTTLKSEGASCMNNQVKKTKHLRQKGQTLTNKEQDEIFQDFSKLKPNGSGSPIGSPTGDDKFHLTEVQQNINVASPVHRVTIQSPVENKMATQMKASPVASPVVQSLKPKTPNTPTLEDRPATQIKANSPLAPVPDSCRKSVSPALVD